MLPDGKCWRNSLTISIMLAVAAQRVCLQVDFSLRWEGRCLVTQYVVWYRFGVSSLLSLTSPG